MEQRGILLNPKRNSRDSIGIPRDSIGNTRDPLGFQKGTRIYTDFEKASCVLRRLSSCWADPLRGPWGNQEGREGLMERSSLQLRKLSRLSTMPRGQEKRRKTLVSDVLVFGVSSCVFSLKLSKVRIFYQGAFRFEFFCNFMFRI